MNVSEIKSLIEMMEESSLTAMEIEVPELKLRLERAGQIPETVKVIPPPAPAAAAAEPQPVPAAQPAPAQEAAAYKEIKSPMVGVFYTSSAPEAEPYVTVGSQVKKGDTVCIVEAMKLMNEIAAEEEGKVVEVCAQNGQIVEYGQTLFKLA